MLEKNVLSRVYDGHRRPAHVDSNNWKKPKNELFSAIHVAVRDEVSPALVNDNRLYPRSIVLTIAERKQRPGLFVRARGK